MTLDRVNYFLNYILKNVIVFCQTHPTGIINFINLTQFKNCRLPSESATGKVTDIWPELSVEFIRPVPSVIDNSPLTTSYEIILMLSDSEVNLMPTQVVVTGSYLLIWYQFPSNYKKRISLNVKSVNIKFLTIIGTLHYMSDILLKTLISS